MWWHWPVSVVLAFALAFTLFRLWNRDTRGAFQIVAALILIFALALSISGCTVSREYQPWLEVGMAYDTQHTVGGDPVCVVRLREPIHFGPIPPGGLVASWVHHSSCPDQRDANTIDQFEITARIPLGRPK